MTPENRKGTVSLRQISGSARSTKIKADLGEASSFTELPALVKVGNASYRKMYSLCYRLISRN